MWAAVRAGFSRLSATASSSARGIDTGAGLAQRGRQGLETASAVAADPAIQGVPGVAVRLIERTLMGALGDRSHDPSP
jgi:hypothetical protein